MKPSPTGRRQFLLESTGIALGGLAPASRLAGQDEDRKPVRVAVVGTGARGSDLIRALTTIDGADLVAICDDYEPHRSQAHAFAGPQAEPFSDYRRMLETVRPDAVVIAVPLDLHHDFCLAAMDAGAAVFCEKMMAYDLNQARSLVDQVERLGAVFQVGLQRRANAIYRQAVAMVRAGMLGEVTAIKAQWHRNSSWRRPVPVPRDHIDWRGLERRLNWRLFRDRSQGLMAELGSHQVDVATWVLGGPPRRVIGSGGIDWWRDGREVFDNVFCIYEYESRPAGKSSESAETREPAPVVRVTYSSLQTNAYEGASELILGTKGTLFLTPGKGLFFREGAQTATSAATEGSLDEAQREAALVTSGKTLKMANDPWAHRGKPFEMDVEGDDTREELVSFLDCVRRQDRETLCTARDGLINTSTILMANQAMETGEAVEWPSEIPA